MRSASGVASGVPPDVEGWRPAARSKCEMFNDQWPMRNEPPIFHWSFLIDHFSLAPPKSDLRPPTRSSTDLVRVFFPVLRFRPALGGKGGFDFDEQVLAGEGLLQVNQVVIFVRRPDESAGAQNPRVRRNILDFFGQLASAHR